MQHNILLVDDHHLFLEGLLKLLKQEADLNILSYGYSGADIINYLKSHPEEQVDLVITDISMPDLDGISLNKQLKKLRPAIKTLVLSMHMDANIIDTLIQDDVDGYLSKNTDSEELLSAIRTIMEGEKYFSEVVKEAYLTSALHKKKATLEMLTEREKSILKLIAEEFTTQEIADKLFLSKHTIETYRKTLFTKLNVRNLAGLTKYAIKFGLID